MQDAAIRQYFSIRPGFGTAEDLIFANSAVMVTVLTTAMASTSFLPGNGRPSVSRAAQAMHSPRAPTCASAVY